MDGSGAKRHVSRCGAITVALLAVACRPAAEAFSNDAGAANVAETLEAVRTADDRQPAAVTPAIEAARTPAQALVTIASNQRACLEADPNPVAMQACDSQVIDATNALLRRSRGNDPFDALLGDLFGPLMFARTGGEDALRERVVNMRAYAQLAQRRAAILTGAEGAGPARERGGTSLSGLLGRLGNRRTAGSFERRWIAIRNADCEAYPVPRCAARLDAAFGGMIEDLLSDE